MSTDVREILQTVPAELTKNCQGLALDMGKWLFGKELFNCTS